MNPYLHSYLQASPLLPPSNPKSVSLRRRPTTAAAPPPPPYSALIQSCIDSHSFAAGKSIHAQMLAAAFTPNPHLQTKILMLYARSGDLATARHLFDEMPHRNSTSYNTMILAYARADDHLKVLRLFSAMRGDGIAPDKFTFPSAVKACIALDDAANAVPQLHCLIVKAGLSCNVVVGSTVIDAYAAFGSADAASAVFDGIDEPNVVAWNAVMGGYVGLARWEETWGAFYRMQEDGLGPGHFSLATAVRACGALRSLHRGKQVHAKVVVHGYVNDVFVGNSLIDMYAKCCAGESCAMVFEFMGETNQVTWNSIISSYASLGYYEEALELFSRMQKLDFRCDRFNLGSGLMACAATADVDRGRQFNGYLVRRFIDSDLFLGSAIVDMYAKCGFMEDAHRAFDRLAERNEVSWNALIAGYAQEEIEMDIAIGLYERMRSAGIVPDQFTFASLLTLSANQGAEDLGKQIHAHIIRTIDRPNIVLETELVHMYSRCGRLKYAKEIFDRMPERNAYSWNSMIKGYEQNDRAMDALQLFLQMQLNGTRPDSFSLAIVFSACTSLSALTTGKEIHGFIFRNMLESHTILRCLLVDLYAKCEKMEYAYKTYDKAKGKDIGLHNAMIKALINHSTIDEARRVFDEMEEKSTVSWNLVLMGYAKGGLKNELSKVFQMMVEEGVDYDCSTLVTMFNLFSSLPALEQGEQLHAAMIKRRLTHSSVLLDSGVIDLYAKVGSIKEARCYFDRMKERNVVTWNTMITGYGKNGRSSDVLALLEQMKGEKIEPNDVTFLSVLSACSHTGLVEEGINVFTTMLEECKVEPRPEHYTCMVDLLGRAGLVKESKELIERMPFEPDVSTWGALLGACRIHKDVSMGRLAANNLFQLDPKNSSHYILMANIYVAAGKWEEADGVRELMRARAEKKEPGVSWIEIGNKIQMFYAGDETHPQIREIYAALKHLSTVEGEGIYAPDSVTCTEI